MDVDPRAAIWLLTRDEDVDCYPEEFIESMLEGADRVRPLMSGRKKTGRPTESASSARPSALPAPATAPSWSRCRAATCSASGVLRHVGIGTQGTYEAAELDSGTGADALAYWLAHVDREEQDDVLSVDADFPVDSGEAYWWLAEATGVAVSN